MQADVSNEARIDESLPTLRRFLAWRAALIVILQGLFVLLLIGFWQWRVQSDALRDIHAKRASGAAGEVVSLMQGARTEVMQTAAALATMPAMQAHPREATQDLLSRVPAAVTAIAVDASGVILAGAPPLRDIDGRDVWDGLSVADRDYFLVPMRRGGTFVSPVFTGRGYGRQELIAVSAAVPDWSPALGPVALVQASIPLQALRERLPVKSGPTDSVLLLLDSEMSVVAGNTDGTTFARGSLASALRTALDGMQRSGVDGPVWASIDAERWLLDRRRLDDGWSLLALTPASALRAGFLTAMWPPLAGVTLLTGLLLVFVMMVAARLGREGERYAALIESWSSEDVEALVSARRQRRISFREAQRVYAAMTGLLVRASASLARQQQVSADLDAARLALQAQVDRQEDEIRGRTTALLNAVTELRSTQQLLEEAQVTGRVGVWAWRAGDDRLFLSAGAQRLLAVQSISDYVRLDEAFASVRGDARARVEAEFRRAHANGASLLIDVEVIDAQGSAHQLLIRGAHGRISGSAEWLFRGTVLDNSERVRAERRMTELLDLLDVLALPAQAAQATLRQCAEAIRVWLHASEVRLYWKAGDACWLLAAGDSPVLVRRRDEVPDDLFAPDAEPEAFSVRQAYEQQRSLLLASLTNNDGCIGIVARASTDERLPRGGYGAVLNLALRVMSIEAQALRFSRS